jgi:glycosyltransferase involved in cell wall biosynthesis
VRTTLLSTAVPNPDSGSGAAITLALIADALAERGHDVSICPVVYPEYVTPDGADYRRQVDAATALGYELHPVISDAWRGRETDRSLRARLGRAMRPDRDELYPEVRDAEAVRSTVEHLAPDAVLVYGFAALAASTHVPFPRFAATSDPPQESLRARTIGRRHGRADPIQTAREAVHLQAAVRGHKRLARELLRNCEAVGAFGDQHAESLRLSGIPCRYYRTPVADPGPPSAPPGNPRHRLLLVGHLQGTATLDGLRVFEAMLPQLERMLGTDGFEVRIVGGYAAPPEAQLLLEHPAVIFEGFVEDVDAEFRAADVLVVPVSIRLGVRVRVLTGFAHGCCIVAHQANAAGIPELAHGENALLGSSASELADSVVSALRHGELANRLRRGARETYERYFAPSVAGAALAETLEHIAAGGRLEET